MSEKSQVIVTLINTSEEDVIVYWKDDKDGNDLEYMDTLGPNTDIKVDSFIGDAFIYSIHGDSHDIIVGKGKLSYIVGPTEIVVKCSTTEGDISAHILPEWSPYGANRFLELVRIGYFHGCSLNRIVKKFLAQFGISADYDMRMKYRDMIIKDDDSRNIRAFKPGFMSFAGSGPNSRSTEMFIVMPDTPEGQLEYFGKNPWETPFGYVKELGVVDKWYSYGDMPPWGEGPDPQKIYRKDGYHYLKTEFPSMSYIEKCEIVWDSLDKDRVVEEKDEL